MSDPVRMTDDGVRIELRVIPKSSRNEISGVRDGRLLVKVTVPPEGGKANQAVIKLLAKAWKIPASSFEVIRGASSRTKTILIKGYLIEDIPLRVE